MNDYQLSLPVRWSSLKNIGQSPAHYKYWMENIYPETDAMRIGSFVHRLVLGGHREFVKYERTRLGKDWDAFFAEHGTLSTILNEREWEHGRAIADAVQSNKLAMSILTAGAQEKTIFWEVCGRKCKGTPDTLGDAVLADLKVTNSANPKLLQWHAVRQLWHGQLAWYRDGSEKKPEKLYIVAVENKPPFPVTVMELAESAINAGQRLWQTYFDRLRQCEESDSWPAYSDVPVTLELHDDQMIYEEEDN